MQFHKQQGFSQKYEKLNFIGRGTFGSVYKVKDRYSYKCYAAKIISLVGMTHTQILRADQERLIHSKLSHPNILKLHQSYLEDDQLIFIMQFCQYGDLHSFLQKRKEDNMNKMPETVIMNIFIQLLYGIQYLHSQGVIHRDIKPSNIFVDSKGIAKIADFGISKVVNHSSINLTISQQSNGNKLHVTGTPLYLSPQACKNQHITFKSDVWSLGCVLFQLCTLEHAFQAANILALAKMIYMDDVRDIGEEYSEDLSALVRWMLDKDPDNRPEVWQMLGLSLVKKYVKQFQNKNFDSPKKSLNPSSLGSSSLGSSSSLPTQSSPTFKIIQREVTLNQSIQPHQQNTYYSKLRLSCHNLLGGQQQFAQMYNQIKQLTQQITIIHQKDRHFIQNKLRDMYGQDYYDISKAMLQLVQYQASV